MTTPSPKTKAPLRLARSMARYDFSREPLKSADIVIDKTGRVCKDRHGTAGRNATKAELNAAKRVGPNR